MAEPRDLFAEAAAPSQPRDLFAEAGGGGNGESPGIFQGMTDTASRYATFGLSPHAAAAGSGVAAEAGHLLNLLAAKLGYGPIVSPEKAVPFSEAYSKTLQDQRDSAAAFSAAHPYANAAAAATGLLSGAAGAGMGAPATLGGRIARGAGTGAGIGAVSGAADAPDLASVPKSAAVGAGMGALAGGAAPVAVEALSPVAQAVARGLGRSTADQQAIRRIAQSIGADEAAGGPGVSQIASDLSDTTKPLTIADVGGENVRALTGRVARAPGEGRQVATQFLNERDAESGTRLLGDLRQMVTSGKSAYATARDLAQTRQVASAPAYNAFYAAPPMRPGTLAEETLGDLLNRPSMRQAARRALSIAQEEGRDPMTLGIQFGENGQPQFERVPSWQTLDYIKRGLDDVLNKYRDTTTGRLRLDERGRAINDTLHSLVNFMDEETKVNGQSLYRAARGAYSGPSQSIDAMRRGQQFLSRDPEAIADDLSRMLPGDREFFRVGAADALRGRINSTGPNGNEALAAIKNTATQDRIRAVFGDQADDFLRSATDESRMFSTRNATLGNSQTAARVAEDAAQNGPSITGPLIRGAVALAAHEPVLGAASIARGAQGLIQRLQTASPAVNAAMARALLNSNPAVRQELFAQLLAAPQGNRADQFLATRLSTLAGRALPTLDRITSAGTGR